MDLIYLLKFNQLFLAAMERMKLAYSLLLLGVSLLDLPPAAASSKAALDSGHLHMASSLAVRLPMEAIDKGYMPAIYRATIGIHKARQQVLQGADVDIAMEVARLQWTVARL